MRRSSCHHRITLSAPIPRQLMVGRKPKAMITNPFEDESQIHLESMKWMGGGAKPPAVIQMALSAPKIVINCNSSSETLQNFSQETLHHRYWETISEWWQMYTAHVREEEHIRQCMKGWSAKNLSSHFTSQSIGQIWFAMSRVNKILREPQLLITDWSLEENWPIALHWNDQTLPS